MKKYLHKGLVVIGLLCLPLTGVAQNKATTKGDREFNQMGFAEAILDYERAISKGDRSIGVLSNLAESYFVNGQYADAKKWYDELFITGGFNPTADQYYNYVQTLKNAGDYQKADALLDRMSQVYPSDNRVILYNKDKYYMKTLRSNPYAYGVRHMPSVNTPYAEFGSAMYKGSMIFSSSQERTNYYQRIHSWTNDPFTKIYSVEVFIDGRIGKTKPFSKQIESKFNQSTPAFTKDEKTMYFSSNDRDQKPGSSTNYMNLYKATYNGKVWTNIVKLPFNVEGASTAHPALTNDENWLYFVSDRDGGFGNSDLYRVEILPSGVYGPPQNLGSQINTESRESFPYISKENVLYFASDGQPGMGGLDVYGVQLYPDGSFGSVVNLGPSVNTAYDDFAFYLDSEGKYGFMSSNRPGGLGKDDLYFVREAEGIDLSQHQTIYGRVYDLATLEPIVNAQVSLHDSNNNIVGSVISNPNGDYTMEGVTTFIGYSISVQAPDYNYIQIGFDPFQQGNKFFFDFGLQRSVPVAPALQIEEGQDLMKVLNLEPIYFEFDSATITSRAEIELQYIYKIMVENPTMTILVRSHTDNRGAATYNLVLSQRRADSTKEWLVKQGISPSRIKTIGVGSTEPINECSKVQPCTELQYLENRRSEFIITKL
ncbi:OmpA family protein [Myroides sp. LJL115]